jgi:protein-disulfide isomerase
MTRTLARFTLLVFALTLSISAFAASKGQNVTFSRDVQLNGKTLPAGDYTVKCDTSGSTAQVQFLKAGKEVATATGQTKQLSFTPDYNQVVTTDGNGGRTLSEIDFAHSTTGVTFESGAMSSAGGN